MAERFRVAVVGSGPAGLSAAAQAAERGISHVLIERTDHLSDTIYKYQKGKFVMGHPEVLPLRSPLSFGAGQRETVLDTWSQGIAKLKTNVRHNAEMTGIAGAKGAFRIALKSGETVEAEHVVLSIGLQGNIRTLGVPGQERPWVQYQLDDPKEYDGETIVVVGAGDAGIENAIGLSDQNSVIIINLGDEFVRSKPANNAAILKAIADGRIECFYKTSVARVEDDGIVVKTPDGEAHVKCDRVIARLGADPPRKLVEACGVTFPSQDRAALPELSPSYESNVPGLYIIGALAGYPLIKQAMNQGYEVIETILGNPVEPADEPLLRKKFEGLGPDVTVDQIIQTIQANVPVLSGLTTLQLREFMLDSKVHFPTKGTVIFQRNDFTSSFYSIVEGAVAVQFDPADPSKQVVLGTGQFVGEMSLISGRRRTATVVAHERSVLIETPRRSMIKLVNSVASVRRALDEAAMARQIQTHLSPSSTTADLAEVVASAKIAKYSRGDVLFREGDKGDGVHLIRSGSVMVSRQIGGRDIVLSYVAAGNYIGEMSPMTEALRSATVRAAVATETVVLESSAFMGLLSRSPELRKRVETQFQDRLMSNVRMENRPESGNIIQFLIEQGVGEATDVLLIDESLCVRCDNCEKACAETHGGTSRLNREAGPTYATVHVPTSCRHCEHPHCMADCPPDAIHRSPNGEVFIADNCIGCGNCQRNCPYGVIQMAGETAPKPGLLSWLLFGSGPGPGQDKRPKAGKKAEGRKVAVKCDMCKDIAGGPACVRSCPTGAAIRVKPEEFLVIASRKG
ncbi:MAG: cyclic nucleotide-binding domain-containing protein [Alphaproteobacteria bacterium]|nr:cyclic nucleotide-binding domain-containing protein [Alphaproteobacteria bacterium]